MLAESWNRVPPALPIGRYTNARSSVSIVAMYDDMVAVIENRPLTGGHFLLSLDAPRQAPAVRPGQFAMVRILGRSDVLLRRPMSIFDVTAKEGRDGGPRRARAPRILKLLYKVVGRGTRLMAELQPRDKVGLLAPLGHGFFEEEYLPRAHESDEILHVAGGIGIAALLLPAKRLAEAGFRQRLFFGARTKDDLVGVQDFKPLVCATLSATEDGSAGYRGFVTRPLEEYLTKHTDQKFLLMVCGPWAMLRATVELAKRFRHPCLVSMENRMGCGLGVCLGCCIRVEGEGHEAYQRVCTEGPVFWAEKVVWETERKLGIRD
ncbi:MAG: dihydroorotate dehydrogenase electron transfer subunit [Acidobacteriia bacterium]|nr:dihydroorotate dehydrogenase electron transfer subunit [Terriglobia bacterium]